MDQKNDNKKRIRKELLIFVSIYILAFISAFLAQGIFQKSPEPEWKAFILGSILIFITLGLLLVYPIRALLRLIKWMGKKKEIDLKQIGENTHV